MALKTSCLGWREPEEGGRFLGGSPALRLGAARMWLPRQPQRCQDGTLPHLLLPPQPVPLCAFGRGAAPGAQDRRGRGAALWGYTDPPPAAPPRATALGRCSKGQLWHLRADWIKDLVWNPILLQSTHLSWEALGFHPWHSDGPGAQSPPQEQPPLQQREHKDLCRANTQSPNTPSQKEHIPS